MRIKSFQLEKFRNHESLRMDAENGINCIFGENARGKTNILEALYVLALTKSFRAPTQEDLIHWEQEFARVTAEFESTRDQESFTLEAFFGKYPHPKRAFKKNSVKIPQSKFIGNCQMVFFHPEDLNILYLGPDLRRHYIDILNIQINPRYYSELRKLKKILEQRNSLLRKINEGFSSIDQLGVWNEQLAETGATIINERIKALRFLNKLLSSTYSEISEKEDKINLKYKNPITESPVNPGEITYSETEIKTQYEQVLKRTEERDINAMITTKGPHRDDIEFYLNGKPLAAHASRGEYRSLLLALKVLELKFYQEKTGEKPILLLDDVFSELDFSRQHKLLSIIQEYQSFITATHIDEIVVNRMHQGLRKFEIREGKFVQAT